MRPLRQTISDFAGRTMTLGAQASCWQLLAGSPGASRALVLGLGPGVPGQLRGHAEVHWLEAPEVLAQIQTVPPPGWRRLDLRELESYLGQHCEDTAIYFYASGLKAAPAFWGPLLAKIHVALLPAPVPRKGRSAWLPGNAGQLVHAELAMALEACGFDRVHTAEAADAVLLPECWQGEKPHLALSVNFRGLDGKGRIFELLRAMRIPVAVWLVDNPWHLLSGIELPWWKETDIFVTDPTFLEPLRHAGAAKTHFLPLAAAWHMLDWQGPRSCGKPLFVGRSQFPEKKSFFAGVRANGALLEQAARMLARGERPDFHWWARQYGVALWPGKGGRPPGLGAEECSCQWRAQWLRALAPYNPTVIGDSGWSRFLPQLKISPPVDYYKSLPAYYANAVCSVNATSLLLPGSLNQRHFDVWAAGGFLLSDATKGLELFPRELAEPISLATPQELAAKIDYYAANPGPRLELANSWREVIAREHTYACRLRELLEKVGVEPCKMSYKLSSQPFQ